MPGAKRYHVFTDSASIGFNRDAFSAGENPEPIPTMDRITNEMSIALIEACRRTANS
jgi:hypothetical protein